MSEKERGWLFGGDGRGGGGGVDLTDSFLWLTTHVILF